MFLHHFWLLHGLGGKKKKDKKHWATCTLPPTKPSRVPKHPRKVCPKHWELLVKNLFTKTEEVGCEKIISMHCLINNFTHPKKREVMPFCLDTHLNTTIVLQNFIPIDSIWIIASFCCISDCVDWTEKLAELSKMWQDYFSPQPLQTQQETLTSPSVLDICLVLGIYVEMLAI